MPRRVEHSTGTDWEEAFGYSRAVRASDTIRVSGTAPVEDGETVAPNDPYEQAAHVFEVVGDTLAEFDAGPADVVATRVYVVEFDDWEPIDRTGSSSVTCGPRRRCWKWRPSQRRICVSKSRSKPAHRSPEGERRLCGTRFSPVLVSRPDGCRSSGLFFVEAKGRI